jgi:nitrile hydratase accessory protein
MSTSPSDPTQIPGLPVEDDEPVFQAPWEARAFAIVNQLATAKYYSWAEWTNYLVNEISASEQASPSSKTYYEQWVIACEKLLTAKGLLDSAAIDQKIAELLAECEAEHEH